MCRDNEESTDQKEVLVNVYPNVELTIGEVLQRLNVTIKVTNNATYDSPNLDTDREVTIEEEENDEEESFTINDSLTAVKCNCCFCYRMNYFFP